MPVTIEIAERQVARVIRRNARALVRVKPRVRVIKKPDTRFRDELVGYARAKKNDIVYYEGHMPFFTFRLQRSPEGRLSFTTVNRNTVNPTFLTDIRWYTPPFGRVPRLSGCVLPNSVVPDDVRALFNAALVQRVLKRESQHVEYARRVRLAHCRLMRAVLEVSARKEVYVACTRVLGARPTEDHMVVMERMLPAARELLDTPAVLLPVLRQYVERAVRARRVSTRTSTLNTVGRLTGKRITLLARKAWDPNDELLPRHWRWLMRVPARQLRDWAPTIAEIVLACDYFPNDLPLAHQLGRQNVNMHIPVVQVTAEAIRRYNESPKRDARHPWYPVMEQARLLQLFSHHGDTVKVDGDLRRASLRRLYALAQGLERIEPRGSLTYGRFELKSPSGRAPVTVGQFTFHPLLTHVDLFEEGVRMQHCLFGGWVGLHKDGSRFSYSMTDGIAPVATLMLRQARGRWDVDQLVKKLNYPIDRSTPAYEAALEFVAGINVGRYA